MNRFTLKFSNRSIESEYSKIKHIGVSENIKMCIFFPVIIELSLGIPAILHADFRSFFITLGVIGLLVTIACLRNRLERYCRFLAFLVILVFSFVRPYFLPRDLEFTTPGMILLRGYTIATLQIALMMRFAELCQKTLGVFVTFAVRYSISGIIGREIFDPVLFVYGILIDCFLIYVFYSNEQTERKIFLNSWESREQFRKFKELVDNYLPQSILILNPRTSKCLFSNKATVKTFQADTSPASPTFSENLLSVTWREDVTSEIHSLQVVQGTVNVIGPLQHFQTCNTSKEQPLILKDLIHQFALDPSLDCKAISLSACRTVEDAKQTFGVILAKIKWDEENAVAIILNDVTYQENILALKIADENKDKTLVTVSHELRTPLNGIIGILEMAVAKIADQQVLEYLGLCKDNAQLLLGLVNSILDFEQIKQGKLKINVAKVKIAKALTDITRLFNFQCSQKAIFLALNIDKDTPTYINTDENRLKQILINLVGNAIKFTSKGGITIGIIPDPEDVDCVCISVTDTGIGIKEEDIGKLFKMYGKLKDGETINKNGVGLGLTISSALAQLLSGRTDDEGIQVESKFGEGAVFRFRLARDVEKQIKPNEEVSESLVFGDECMSENEINEITSEYPQGFCFDTKISQFNSNSLLLRGQTRRQTPETFYNDIRSKKLELYFEKQIQKIKNGTILVVDDNPFNLMVARNNIDKLGYNCETACNGDEAIDKVKSNATTLDIYKIILMDQHMPILDGIAATRILKDMIKKGDISSIPIIALTANNDEKSIKECYECGMSDYLPKPFNSEDFAALLSRLRLI